MPTLCHHGWNIAFNKTNTEVRVTFDERPGIIVIHEVDGAYEVAIWDEPISAVVASCWMALSELDDNQPDPDDHEADASESLVSDVEYTCLHHLGWEIRFSDEANRLYVSNTNHPGSIHLKADDEGFIADVWPSSLQEVATTCAALYSDLAAAEDESA